MPDKNWKRYERWTSQIFGTVRNPLSGINSRHTGSDTLNAKLFIDCKLRKQYKSIVGLFAALEQQAIGESKLPVLILKTPFTQDMHSLVICKIKDIKAICDEIKDLKIDKFK